MHTARTRMGTAFALVLGAAFTGCGTPGAPQPPSLNLPNRVTDLSGERMGDTVTLTWTMPKRNTDKIPLKSNVAVEICRAEAATACRVIAHLEQAPGADATYSDKLPPDLSTGPPRPLRYSVELNNRNGRSAGPSDAATVPAGSPPPSVQDLAAEVRKAGIVLRWKPDPQAVAEVRLVRTLLTPQQPKQHEGLTSPPSEPAEQRLVVPAVQAGGGRVLDSHIIFGNTYEYRAQRVVRLPLDGQTVELDGELSPPVRIEALDVFPPAVPTGLAAVATAPDPSAGVAPSIDLSWEPDTEPDLAGYEVYRREDVTPWQRISGDQAVAGPAFHDAHVLPGHTYRYSVSAVDRAGHESTRSAEAQETVPNP